MFGCFRIICRRCVLCVGQDIGCFGKKRARVCKRSACACGRFQNFLHHIGGVDCTIHFSLDVCVCLFLSVCVAWGCKLAWPGPGRGLPLAVGSGLGLGVALDLGLAIALGLGPGRALALDLGLALGPGLGLTLCSVWAKHLVLGQGQAWPGMIGFRGRNASGLAWICRGLAKPWPWVWP